MTPMLETERLVLRRPRASDAAAIADGLNNFAVAGNLSRVPCPYTLDDAHAWLRLQAQNEPPARTGFAITLYGTYIGQVGLHDDIQGTVLGYWLAEPYWGRGIVTEAAGAVVDWYFAATEAEQLGCGALDFNAASLRIQHKLGFTQIGVSTRHCLARRAELRHIDTELTRARWAEKRS